MSNIKLNIVIRLDIKLLLFWIAVYFFCYMANIELNIAVFAVFGIVTIAIVHTAIQKGVFGPLHRFLEVADKVIDGNTTDSLKDLKMIGLEDIEGSFKNIVGNIKKSRDNIFLSTDLIVGFPGETDTDFENSKNLIEEIGFSYVHLFTFSPREGTAAYTMSGKVADGVVENRMNKLENIVTKLNYNYKRSNIGRILKVLIERSKNNNITGKSENYLDIIVKTNLTLERKSIYEVKVVDMIDGNLYGELK